MEGTAHEMGVESAEQGPGPERERTVEPAAAASGDAEWLRQQLLEVSAALYPDRPPVVIRTWSDTVRFSEPQPVGRRDVLLVAVGGDERPASPDLDDVLQAFEANGWVASAGYEGAAGERSGTARRAECEVRIHEGAGPGVLTFTGWTPVVFTGRRLAQPMYTTSTLDGMLCDDCHGWGVCMDCEGTGRSDSGMSGGRCWCFASSSGPGRCIECGGRGQATPGAAAWKRRRQGIPDPGGAEDPVRPPVGEGHVSGIDALADVVHRPCACGEFRCLWSNSVAEDGHRLVARFTGVCQGCEAQRAYAFALPYRKLPAPPPPPSPPSCPRCGGTSVPMVSGLHFPGSGTMRAQERGLVAAVRHSCEVRPDDPNWQCASCRHRWRDADRLRWTRVLRHVLATATATATATASGPGPNADRRDRT